MQFGSKIAFIAAMGVGLTAVVAPAPAFAKKEAAPKERPLNLSDKVRAPIVAAQAALTKTPADIATAQAQLQLADAAAKNDDERYIAASLRLQLEDAKIRAMPEATRTDAGLAGPLDALLANPSTPADKVAMFANFRGGIAYNAKDYKAAAVFFAKARDLGYKSDGLLLNLARAKVESGDVIGGVAELDAAVKAEQAAGRKAPEDWYRYAVGRLYKLGATEQVDAWTRGWLTNYGTKENWRVAIYSFGFSGASAQRLTDRNRIDLYRLMRATNSLAGAKEYIDYADAALKIGLPTEAKSVIEEGFASKIIPVGNMTGTDMGKQAVQAIAADKPIAVQEKAAATAPKGDVAGQVGDAYLGQRNFAKAVEMYQLAATKGVADADRLNLHLGIAMALGGDKAGAQAALAKVAAAPNAEIARLWITWIVTPPAA